MAFQLLANDIDIFSLTGNYEVDNFFVSGRGPFCFYSMIGNQPHWSVDLGSTKRIGTIVIFSMSGAVGSAALANFVIRVGNSAVDTDGITAVRMNTPITSSVLGNIVQPVRFG